jgi:spore coat polysaccharide biosynthesis protein SpsF (cytidylyltransferase family)
MTGVIGIIRARLASSRFPAKILAPIAEQPLLAVLTGRPRVPPR